MAKNLINRLTAGSKPVAAFLLAILMLIWAAPVVAPAQESAPAGGTRRMNPILIDGERAPVDGEQVLNIVPVAAQSGPMAVSGGFPPVSGIVAVSAEFAGNPNVSMDGLVVSALRYAELLTE